MSTTYPYLGTPGVMQQLPGPNGTIDAAPSRSETIHTLLSGGVAKSQRLLAKRKYTLPYLARPGTNLSDLLTSFYEGMYDVTGTDFVYVDPAVSNVLDVDVASMGRRPGSAHGWVASAGTAQTTTAQTAPVLGSAVLQWSPGASANVQPGSTVSTADTTKAPVYLPGEPVAVSVYLKGSLSGTVNLVLAGFDKTGATVSTSLTTSCALTTSWQKFTITAAAGVADLSSSVLVLPRITTGASGYPTTIYLANAQLEYASTVSDWQRGYGSPRVLISASPGWSQQKYDGYVDHTLTLAEV